MTEGFTWQALNALVFFYKAVCGMDEVNLEIRLRKTEKRIPVVPDVAEVIMILNKIDEKYRLMACIQYGGGLRLIELLRLRVKDVDERRGIVTVRGGKGDKDRTTVLPESLRAEVAERKAELRKLFERDRAAGLAGTWLPEALERKHPRGGEKWPWQYFFRQPRRQWIRKANYSGGTISGMSLTRERSGARWRMP